MTDPRYDIRTPKQAKADIVNGDYIEGEIAIRMAIFWYNKTNKWPTLESNSPCFGKFSNKYSEMDHDPDFIFNGHPYQITRADPLCKVSFNQKKNKVTRCIEDNIKIVFVNGFKAFDVPKFLVMQPKLMAQLLDKAKLHKHFGHGYKLCYQFNINWFDSKEWHDLPALTKNIPDAYKEYLRK